MILETASFHVLPTFFFLALILTGSIIIILFPLVFF